MASGQTYLAYPDDTEDYYYFELPVPWAVTVSVEDYAPTSTNGTVALYGPVVGDEEGERIDYYGPPGHSSMSLGPHLLGPGKYYIRVRTVEGHYSTTQLYSLIVNYPSCTCKDTHEPDDHEHYLEWPPLDPGEPVEGYICCEHIHLEDSQWLERDWYYFQIDSLYDIEVDLDVPDTVNYDILLWVGDHWEPSENPERGADEHIEWSPWGIGTYVVVVKSLGDVDNCTPYTLEVTLKPQ